MANYGLSDLDFVLYRGFDVTGLVTGFSDEITNQIEDRTAAGCDVALETFTGLQSATVDMDGFYDSLLTVAMEASPNVGVTTDAVQAVLMYALEGNVVGHACECLAHALKSKYSKSMQSGALHKGAVSWGANSKDFTIDHAVLATILAARTAAGNTQADYADSGPQTTGGGRLYVSVPALALSGRTNLIVQLMDSADHATWASVPTALATFTAPGAQMIEFNGDVDAYTATSWTYTGSGGTPGCTYAAAVKKIAAP